MLAFEARDFQPRRHGPMRRYQETGPELFMAVKNDAPAAPVPVYLVRHGLTTWNREGLVQGWTDVPLSEAGRQQALRLKDTLAPVRFSRVITSTLSRASETARIIAARHDLEPVEYPELREYCCGEWEGKPYLEVRASDRERFWSWFNDPEVTMPGGESMSGASRRVVPVMQNVLGELRASEGPLLVVAHGGINRLIAAYLMNVDLEIAKRMRLDNASLSIFEPFLGSYALRLWNSVSHLDGLTDSEEGLTASRVS
jgi:broad specificity phosphatase PhoE